MTQRFRMIAGPNGSGKSTLADLLHRDYAVNFYTMLNADEIFAEVSKTSKAYTEGSDPFRLLLAAVCWRRWGSVSLDCMVW